MSIIKGKVQAIKQWEKNYGLKINDVWISGKGVSPVQKDDNVMIDTEQNGKYTNIKSIEQMDVPIQQAAGEITSKQIAPLQSPASVKHQTKVKTFAYTTPEQLDNAVNMFASEHKTKAWQPSNVVFQTKNGIDVIYILTVTYEE